MQNKYILLNVIERNINDPQFFNNIKDFFTNFFN